MSGRLSGKRILITRAREQAPALAKLFEQEGATAISIPTIEIAPPQSFQPLDKALKKIPSYDWLILTSVNGVRALDKRMQKMDVDAGLLRRLQVAAIGPATKEAAEGLGLKVTVVPEEYIAESVISALRERTAGKQVLLVRAKVARDVIPQELRRAGAQVDVVEAYETVVPINSAKRLQELLTTEPPDVITFTSSSIVKNFVGMLPLGRSPKDLLVRTKLASIGPITSRTLREVGLWVDVEAKQYTVSGLVETIIQAHRLTS